MVRVVFWDFDGTLATRHGGWRGALIQALTEVIPEHHITAADVAPGLRDGFPWHQPEVGHPQWDTADAWWTALTPLLEQSMRSDSVISSNRW